MFIPESESELTEYAHGSGISQNQLDYVKMTTCRRSSASLRSDIRRFSRLLFQFLAELFAIIEFLSLMFLSNPVEQNFITVSKESSRLWAVRCNVGKSLYSELFRDISNTLWSSWLLWHLNERNMDLCLLQKHVQPDRNKKPIKQGTTWEKKLLDFTTICLNPISKLVLDLRFHFKA